MSAEKNRPTLDFKEGVLREDGSEDSGPQRWSGPLKTSLELEEDLSDAHGALVLGGHTFQLRKRLGRGGMAEVFLANRTGPQAFSRKVVIKRILPERSDDATYVQRFIREASLAAQLHHPNIVEILELGHVEGDYYIVMEFVDGVNLHDMLKKTLEQGKGVHPAIAARVISDVASALHYAHTFIGDDGVRRRIVHRDVSTTNVMVTFSGEIKLVDFGVAKDLNAASLTVGNQIIGKPLYIPPESLKGGKPTLAWDIYALGMVMYKLLAGKPPFTAETGPAGLAKLVNEIAHKQPPPIVDIFPDTPLALEAIALQALAKDPLARQRSAAEVQEQLEVYLATVQVTRRMISNYTGELFGRAVEPTESSSLSQQLPISRTESATPAPQTPVVEYLPPEEPRRSHKPVWIGVAVALLLAVSVVFLFATDTGKRVVDAWFRSDQPVVQGVVEGVPVVQKIPGQIIIECRTYDWVHVDRKLIGKCPVGQPVSVPPGEHVVTVGNRSKTVTVGEGELVTVEFKDGWRPSGPTPRVINPQDR
ncbi:MAG: hypothetical protein A2289_12920 [Deltaproteobacteria bacterium RIFOXYA12_FULL_58_15]|nr:MAG: hypothetical protein A2289_12920 [Deltaproteobacteria bacterium RIFOXYA12_FULL_58_15]OGR13936.1 MAG: hypothetical protein A2341_04425 [Deltaproteobacteria bacterium RIFOXYB12_FULL_58_9]